MFTHDCGTLPVFIEHTLKNGKTSFRRYDRKVYQYGAYIEQDYRCKIDGKSVQLSVEENLYYDARNQQQCFFDDGYSSETVLVHRVPFTEKFPHAEIGYTVWYLDVQVVGWDDDNPSIDQYTGLHVNGDTCGTYIGYREDKNAVVILDDDNVEHLVHVGYIISIGDSFDDQPSHKAVDTANSALARMQVEQAIDYANKHNLPYGCLLRIIKKFHAYFDEGYILARLHNYYGWDIEQFRQFEEWTLTVTV